MSERNRYSSTLDIRPSGVQAPHSFLFLCFNMLYFLPVCGVLLFNYSEGGTSKAADLDSAVLWRISAVFLLGVLAFLLGSRFMRAAKRSYYCRADLGALKLFVAARPFGLMCILMVGIFLASKALLVPLGVYAEYAFETEGMTGGVWSFSMFCSESLLFLSMIALFSTMRRNVTWFFVLTAINGVNLLHGTRIFTMIACIVFCFFQYLPVRVGR